MSKREWFGLAVLVCGGVFGLVAGGPFGLALAAVCLVVGFVLFVASEALGMKRKPASAPEAGPAQSKTDLLVLVKEVHVRPQRAGKFQEIREPDQPDLQFEIFAHCWLVNDTDQRLGVPLVQMSLTKPDGSTVALQQVRGDLGNWRLGRLRDELDSWGVGYLQAAQEPMQELNITEPLEGGATRQGWLHVCAENLTPVQLRNSPITLSVVDSHCQSHIGIAKGPHQVPGRVWPFSQTTAEIPAPLEGPSQRSEGQASTGT
jgi:hypothetical protein